MKGLIFLHLCLTVCITASVATQERDYVEELKDIGRFIGLVTENAINYTKSSEDKYKKYYAWGTWFRLSTMDEHMQVAYTGLPHAERGDKPLVRANFLMTSG